MASIVSDLKGAVTSGCYVEGDRPKLVEKIFMKVPAIVKFMGSNEYLVGDKITWIDFFFVELLDFMQFLTGSQLFKNYPSLGTYFDRVINQPGLWEFWNSEECMKNPFNNKIAKINN